MATRHVVITRISPVSAFKTALSLSLIGLAAWVICVALLYLGMQVVGVWDNVNEVIGGVGGSQIVTFGLVLSVAALMGAITSIIVTVLAPLGAIIYNSIVDLFGGLAITYREEND